MLTFYDQDGAPIAYTEDGEYIYLFDGSAVGYLNDESIYAYDGTHLGWFIDGWIRDHEGDCVYFTEQARGGPVRPVRGIRPVRGVREVRPVRGVREVRPVRAVSSIASSAMRGSAFFS